MAEAKGLTWVVVDSVAMGRNSALGLVAAGIFNGVGLAALSFINAMGLVTFGVVNSMGFVTIGGVNSIGLVAIGGVNSVGHHRHRRGECDRNCCHRWDEFKQHCNDGGLTDNIEDAVSADNSRRFST